MNRKAIISIKSSQSLDVDTISVVTPGEFCSIENGFKAIYEETEISGMDGTKTTLKIFKEHIELIREGTTNALMKFKKDEDNVSLYSTPYGILELKTKTLSLNIDVDENGGKIFVEYEISVQGDTPYKTKLEIEIK